MRKALEEFLTQSREKLQGKRKRLEDVIFCGGRVVVGPLLQSDRHEMRVGHVDCAKVLLDYSAIFV